MNGNYIDLVATENTLKLIPTDELRNIEDNERDFFLGLDHDSAMLELLENYLCNGWEILDGCLFSGLVLFDGENTYFDAFYEVKNCFLTLLEGNVYEFYRYKD